MKEDEKYALVDASWDAIIDNETFNLAQQKLQLNKKIKTSPNYDFILSGLLTCDECGKPLFGQTGTGRSKKHYYYGHKNKCACRVNRYPAPELESLIKKQMFSFLNNKAMSNDFIEAIKELENDKPKTQSFLLASKDKEIKRVNDEIERLINLISSNKIAGSLDTILNKLKENEEKIQVLKQEREAIVERNTLESIEKIDVDFILDGIGKLRSERFRKAQLNKKRKIVRSLIKSIHIHPDNVIRVDFWGSGNQSEALRNDSRKQSGAVLPFREIGQPLEASFGASGVDRFSDVRKAVGFGTYVCANSQFSDLGINAVAGQIVLSCVEKA